MNRPIFILMFVMASFAHMFGCSCDGLPPMEVEFARSDAAFVGRVIQMTIESRNEGNYRYEVRVCRFQIIENFKGIDDQKKEFTLVTRMVGTACGFPFELGERYLVYASAYHGDMETSLCRRTHALVQPKKESVIAGQPDPFAKVEMDESGRIEAEQLRILLKKK